MNMHTKSRNTQEVADRITRLLNEVQRRYERHLPIFREAASLREEIGFLAPDMRAPGWYSELLEDSRYKNAAAKKGVSIFDLHSTIMTWIVLKLREISDTSNWFRPTEALTYKLLATDLKGTVVADLHLPMNAFYIELPPGVLYIEDVSTGWHEVRVLTVVRGELTQRTLDVARANGDHTVDEAILGERILIECYAEPNENSRDPFDDSWLFMSYILHSPETSIEDAIEASDRKSDALRMSRGRCGDRVMDVHGLRKFLMHFVLNLCIYLGSEKAKVGHIHAEEIKRLRGDKKWKHLRKNVQDRIQRMESDRIFDVGSDVAISSEIREHVRHSGAGSYTQTYRTVVRGHWRNQAHGPGRVQRTRKWIEPHVRGADLPTRTVGHNYKVE
jgi:hypothetical protein